MKTTIRATTVIVCFLAGIVVTRLWYLEEQGNFHPITPREAYRSAQLDPDELEYYIRKFNIRSIINLRGKDEGDPLYRQEIATCRKSGVRHYDLGLRADKAPSPRQIEDLVRLFDTAPRPVLIHCMGGADRSGLAAALWKVMIDNAPKSVARKHLSVRYGHMPFGPTQALNAFFEEWVIPKSRLVGAIDDSMKNMT